MQVTGVAGIHGPPAVSHVEVGSAQGRECVRDVVGTVVCVLQENSSKLRIAINCPVKVHTIYSWYFSRQQQACH